MHTNEPTILNSEHLNKQARKSSNFYLLTLNILCVKATFQPKPENIDELKKVLHLVCDQLP